MCKSREKGYYVIEKTRNWFELTYTNKIDIPVHIQQISISNIVFPQNTGHWSYSNKQYLIKSPFFYGTAYKKKANSLLEHLWVCYFFYRIYLPTVISSINPFLLGTDELVAFATVRSHYCSIVQIGWAPIVWKEWMKKNNIT